MVTARRKYCRIRSGSARRNYPTPLTFRNALARAQPNVRTRPWFQSRRASPDVRSSTACGWRGHFGRRGASAGFLRRWDRLDWEGDDAVRVTVVVCLRLKPCGLTDRIFRKAKCLNVNGFQDFRELRTQFGSARDSELSSIQGYP